jgi:hypothetical protein
LKLPTSWFLFQKNASSHGILKNGETPSIRLGKKKKIASSGGPSGASSISFPAEVPAEKRET